MSLRRHPLAPLLSPRSIALVGASQRPNTPGHDMVRMLRAGGFRGTVHAINPNYDEIEAIRACRICGDLPAPPDLAVLSVRNDRLEETLCGSHRHRREVGGDLRVGFSRRATLARRSPSGSPRWRAAARHADLRRQLHGLLQRSRRRVDLRLPEPARSRGPARSRSSPIRAACSARSRTTIRGCASRSPFRPDRSSRPPSPTTSTTRSSGRRSSVIGLFLETARDPAALPRGARKSGRARRPDRRAEARAHRGRRRSGAHAHRRDGRQRPGLRGAVRSLRRDSRRDARRARLHAAAFRHRPPCRAPGRLSPSTIRAASAKCSSISRNAPA